MGLCCAKHQKIDNMSAKPVAGIQFPEVSSGGSRSTTAFGKNLLATAVRQCDNETISNAILKESDWRFSYAPHFMAITKSMAKSSYSDCVTVATNGLNYLLDHLEFYRNGESCPLSQAIEKYGASDDLDFTSWHVVGEKPCYAPTLQEMNDGKLSKQSSILNVEIPMPTGEQVSGPRLRRLLTSWKDEGLMEETAADLLLGLIDDNYASMPLQKRNFVIIGSGSELAPTQFLLRAGANVYAIQTPKPQKLAALAKIAANSPGNLFIPCRGGSPSPDTGGVDLLTDTPEIAKWLAASLPKNEPVTVGMYVYMDGEAHVRATAAAFAISKYLKTLFPTDKMSFAFLGTPTIATIIPKAAHEASRKRLEQASWWQSLLAYSSAVGEPIVDGSNRDRHVFDGIMSHQGPNYSLAKTLQLWSALYFGSQGHVVSSNVGPACRTASVTSNKNAARALDGMHHFPPCKAFSPETASAVMGWLLVADLRDKRPLTEGSKAVHALEPFATCAFHGGVWRAGYRLESTAKTCAVLGSLAPQSDVRHPDDTA